MAMELTAKTEDLPSDIVDNLLLEVVTLNLSGREIDLQRAYQGHDFVFGLSQGCLVAIPFHRVALMQTASLPDFRDISLLQLLALQRKPVELEVQIDGSIRRSWLLNVVGNWLRISSRQGLEWVTTTALVMARVRPVDN
ncbi:MAG: hypothetical protein ACO32L_04980 [Aquiluna sp.]